MTPQRLARWCMVASIAAWASAAGAAEQCGDLLKLNLPKVSIKSATPVGEGPFEPPGSSDALQTSGFCRVVAVANPSPDSIINFEVWIPPVEHWNHYFQGVGNGGYSGAIQYGNMADAVRRGFAAASTDTGHAGADLAFAYGHPEKITDWGYRAIHVMTESAKLIIREYSGIVPRHSFFMGCSTGGHQALSEVQRFPADYDGVVAGDPGNNRVHLNAGFLWAFAATHDADGNLILPSSKLPLINQAAVGACDALDGLKDGVISTPEACRFDPAVLLCKGAENEQCLTAPQIAAVKRVYAGPRNPRTGEQIIAGYAPGSESTVGDDYAGGWKLIADRKEPMRVEFWKYWVFNDPAWDWRSFDYDRDVAFADQKLAAVNATSSDLRAYRSRGGRILMYSGWADPVGPPMDAVTYYERVARVMGGRRATESFFRLFMVPGMAHCGYGPGPNRFGGYGPAPAAARINTDSAHDVLAALVKWVETGSAPEFLIASHIVADSVHRSRPICPYPKVARWSGSGSSDDASNFGCAEARTRTPAP